MLRVIRLFRFEQASGLLMLAAMTLALAAANSPLAPAYALVHHLPTHFRVGPFAIERPLVWWINEGLMVFFFVLMGLELKRQFLEGHLSTAKRAVLPAFAAIGGMLMPAGIYIALTWGDTDVLQGWAIPTATDIVLALGMISLLGRRVPESLRVFLAALAIFDDIGAVLIIGLFYGEGLALVPFLAAIAGLAALALLNAFTVTRPLPYVAVGLFLWIALQLSGIEAALAGVLIAFAVPLRAPGCRCRSPLRMTERRLHPWVTLAIVPLFAFFNAGIAIDATAVGSLLSPASLGIAAGLFLGKPLGILAAAWAVVRFDVARLPRGVSWPQLCGAAMLAGIGFTMSLFIASLAFADAPLVASAKLAVLAGSLLSAATGLAALHLSSRPMARAPAATLGDEAPADSVTR